MLRKLHHPRVTMCAALGSLLGAAFVFAGSGCKKTPAEPTSDAGSLTATATADAAAADAGASDAARDAGTALVDYDDDVVAVDHVALTVKAPSASVRAAIPDGAVLATLLAGTAVTQTAERHGYFKIEAPDPKDASKKVVGWTVKYAFEDERAAPTTPSPKKVLPPRCTGTAIPVKQPGDAAGRCAYACKNDRECSAAGMTCEAAIALPGPTEAPSPTPSYTTVCAVAPGAPKPDAGAPRVPSLFGVMQNGLGKCPHNFTTAPKFGALCYRTCKVDTDCPADAKCKPTPSGKLCFAN